MIEARELKIGNWVSFEDHLIKQQRIVFLSEKADLSMVEPIPLTEDWLLRFGFDYVRGEEYHNKRINEGAFHLKRVGDAFNHWYFYHKDKMITTNIRFVHQLQNIFFAMKSEELELKE
jgi:hypothetical protein